MMILISNQWLLYKIYYYKLFYDITDITCSFSYNTRFDLSLWYNNLTINNNMGTIVLPML